MSPHSYTISHSSIDSERWEVSTARAKLINSTNVDNAIEFCRSNDVTLLIARCSTSDMKTVQAMEKNGFFLMDTLVNYARDLHKTPLPEDSGQIPIRPVQSRDSEQVQQVACEAFKGYSGHYHADERLDSLECNNVYTSWAYNSCSSKELADEVLVADLEGKIVGFATLKFNSTEELAGVLFVFPLKRKGVDCIVLS